MTEQEARQILGVSENSTWEEIVEVCYFPFVSFLIRLAITYSDAQFSLQFEQLCVMQRYDNLFERNAKSGSFYLQSKVHRAKECLETVYQKNKHDEPPNWNPAP
jgi:import inner membrane translocase subunit TIM16